MKVLLGVCLSIYLGISNASAQSKLEGVFAYDETSASGCEISIRIKQKSKLNVDVSVLENLSHCAVLPPRVFYGHKRFNEQASILSSIKDACGGVTTKLIGNETRFLYTIMDGRKYVPASKNCIGAAYYMDIETAETSESFYPVLTRDTL